MVSNLEIVGTSDIIAYNLSTCAYGTPSAQITQGRQGAPDSQQNWE